MVSVPTRASTVLQIAVLAFLRALVVQKLEAQEVRSFFYGFVTCFRLSCVCLSVCPKQFGTQQFGTQQFGLCALLSSVVGTQAELGSVAVENGHSHGHQI